MLSDSASMTELEGGMVAFPATPSTLVVDSPQNPSCPKLEVMGHLDFGLFTAKPRFAELAYQCVPIIWIALVTLWPGLLSIFLRMLLGSQCCRV